MDTVAPADLFVCASDTKDWPMYGHDVCNSRSTRGGSITRETASKLTTKWVFEAAGDVSATPAIVGGALFIPDWGGMIHRLDAATGKVVWSKSVAALSGVRLEKGGPLVSRATPAISDKSVIFGLSPTSMVASRALAWIVAVDRETGALSWKTQLDTHPASFITASPLFWEGRVIVGVSSGEEFASSADGYRCCSFRGSVAMLDASTGAIFWKTPLIDDAAHRAGFSGAPVWSGIAIDRKRGHVIVTTGNDYAEAKGTAAVNHFDSIVALALDSGAIRWAARVTPSDHWVLADAIDPGSAGPDADFGAGPNLFHAVIAGKERDVIGAGQKSGVYWAVDAENGELYWKTKIGPGGHFGGIHWGTAVDGARIYAGVNDEAAIPYTLAGDAGQIARTGSWAALDPATGRIAWQIANPAMARPLAGVSVNGPVTVVNGVVLAGSMDAAGTMFALDGTTGAVLWSFKSGGTVYGGAAVADGVVYWGSGYPAARLNFGTPSKKLYAFAIP
jgi:polyvinyl alcohol dehydrogenase (cytochrome)